MKQEHTPTLSASLAAFADALSGEKHPTTTIDAYVGDVQRWITWLPTITVSPTLEGLTRDDVEDYKTHLAREEGAEAATIRRKLASLRRFTHFLVDRGYASIKEERRRSKVIPRFFDEKSALKICFSSLLRASQRWQRMRMTDWDRLQLDRLRRELYGQAERPENSDLRRKEVAWTAAPTFTGNCGLDQSVALYSYLGMATPPDEACVVYKSLRDPVNVRTHPIIPRGLRVDDGQSTRVPQTGLLETPGQPHGRPSGRIRASLTI